jgi:hypothetical protein
MNSLAHPRIIFRPRNPVNYFRVVGGVSIGKNDLPDVSIVENIGCAAFFGDVHGDRRI